MEGLQNKHNLDNLRHSCAHLLAAAVLELWPGSHNAIGPAIENGFYQDFDLGSIKISEADLSKIEQKMREIVPTWKKFMFKEVTLEEAKKLFKHNPYKIELAKEFAGEGKKLMTNNPGNFLDLCKMGHVENPTRELRYFKLLSIAGAYWRGSEKNKMLTRIYGTCFPTKEELEKYLWQIEEAKKRDHRKIGKQQELFLISQEAGSGFPIYQPRGFLLRRNLEEWLTREKESRGYQFVWTPHIAKSDLYRKSGHWQKYDTMFSPMKLENEEYVAKPMNCPHHFQIFLERPRSYRELPLRIAENATVYRFEKAGELNGLLRVRSLTQDDSHIFVRQTQIAEEIDRILDLAILIYETFGFSDYRTRISVRDLTTPEKYMGNPKSWDKAEQALIDAVKKRKMPYFMGTGEAAFYGPKIDIMVRDALGREWQLTTCQVDFVQPENFDMHYTNEEGQQERPAVLHVAILGSYDRFLGILIEHYAGSFPVWLSPTQVVLLPISEKQKDYAYEVYNELKKAHIRIELNAENESLNSRIRKTELLRVPFILVVGDKEKETKTISVRRRLEGKSLGQLSINHFITLLQAAIDKKTNN